MYFFDGDDDENTPVEPVEPADIHEEAEEISSGEPKDDPKDL